ncbi:MAG: single-stranded DNA-binding protein [Candidatus Omnitrophica bacterium CG11_big_fil_rev_8_21_14_0_20_42_13]|uniref:Single-stranded DNA-binding protein n=1 Tax=Candidatus Ghiorseimicrobium undicola TaxID=1974746 RepID=A0A2H0LZN7_9BACT|nr:MAG: single-stranded DNA-binding protein [Candidatus Omnitrophica bacterium CG11_big_fil_rev_8_21_14_0_20_42_13]
MASLNRIFLIGNLTKDPELRYTPSGIAVANLRIAVNRRFRDKNGEQKEETCFITVVVWDKQAEACNQYLRKGSAVFTEGRLQSRSWDAPDGTKRNTIEVRADRVQFLATQRQASEKPAGSGNVSAEEPRVGYESRNEEDSSDDTSWAGNEE